MVGLFEFLFKYRPALFEEGRFALISPGWMQAAALVAGAVLGARYGAAAIPARWLDCIPQREELEKLADDLLAVGG